MKTKQLIAALFLVSLFFASCSKDKDDDPVVKTTYNKDVKAVFLSNCSPCHLTGGANPNKLDDYTTAKTKIDVIIDRVNRDAAAAGFMPKNGTKLSAEKIAILTKWKTDGLLEN